MMGKGVEVMEEKLDSSLPEKKRRSAIANSILIVLLLILIGFGFLVYILRDLFAVLAAIVFFVTGIGCGITAVKIFWAQHKIDKSVSDDSQPYRENARIHIEEHHDF